MGLSLGLRLEYAFGELGDWRLLCQQTNNTMRKLLLVVILLSCIGRWGAKGTLPAQNAIEAISAAPAPNQGRCDGPAGSKVENISPFCVIILS